MLRLPDVADTVTAHTRGPYCSVCADNDVVLLDLIFVGYLEPFLRADVMQVIFSDHVWKHSCAGGLGSRSECH